MKVEIITDKKAKEYKWGGNKVETIEFAGNTILPWYISVLSMEHYPDKLVIRMCDDYQTKITHSYDVKNKKSDDKLWIMGKDKQPSPEVEEKMR